MQRGSHNALMDGILDKCVNDQGRQATSGQNTKRIRGGRKQTHQSVRGQFLHKLGY